MSEGERGLQVSHLSKDLETFIRGVYILLEMADYKTLGRSLLLSSWVAIHSRDVEKH